MEDLKPMIKIIYEDNHILVVEKPVNIPVQEDSSRDIDFLTMLKEDIKKRYQKPGNVYLGLVHRLDRPVGGIMVFAKTSKAASRLSEQVRTHQFHKKYYAVVNGKLKDSDIYEDYLLKNPKTNIVKVDKKGKFAELSYHRIGYDKNTDMSLVDITLKTGRSHQIRVQFSHHGHPLYGDQKYSKTSQVGEQIALFSYQLSFTHPTTKERLEFTLNRPNSYPWTIFK